MCISALKTPLSLEVAISPVRNSVTLWFSQLLHSLISCAHSFGLKLYYLRNSEFSILNSQYHNSFKTKHQQCSSPRLSSSSRPSRPSRSPLNLPQPTVSLRPSLWCLLATLLPRRLPRLPPQPQLRLKSPRQPGHLSSLALLPPVLLLL